MSSDSNKPPAPVRQNSVASLLTDDSSTEEPKNFLPDFQFEFHRGTSSHNNNNQEAHPPPFNRESKEEEKNYRFEEKRPRLEKDQVVHTIAKHYNDRPNLGVAERQNSRILNLKNLNNWIKSVLISRFCQQNGNILDICAGKGGDLAKINLKQPQNLVFADVAHESVKDAIDRFNEKHQYTPVKFIAADCFKPGLTDSLPSSLKFDFANCQFALHYSFETEEKAKGLLSNVSSRLNPGCYFVATIPNSYWIVKRLRESKELYFGNEIFEIEFDQKESFPRFGSKYLFSLEESIDRCPEFLVHIPTLSDLAKEFGMELVYNKGFHDFFAEFSVIKEYESLLSRMKVWNRNGTISHPEWEVAGAYMVVVFKKRGERANKPAVVNPNPLGEGGKQIRHEDILVL